MLAFDPFCGEKKNFAFTFKTKVTYTFPKLFTLNGFSSSTYTEFVWRQFLIDALGMLFDESFKQPTLA